MSRWRELARRLCTGDEPANRDCRAIATVGAIVPKVSNVPAPLALSLTPSDPASWSAALTMLEASRPPAGINPGWWRTLLADARWIALNHGEAAAAMGWTASDLFGVRPHLGPGEGGLADRLDGARTLVLTETIAHWQGEEWAGWLWRRTLSAKPLLWPLGV